MITDIVCVFHAGKHGVPERKAPLPQLCSGVLADQVLVLDPAMMGSGRRAGDVLLEDDHVGVGDLLSITRGENRGSIVVDGVD